MLRAALAHPCTKYALAATSCCGQPDQSIPYAFVPNKGVSSYNKDINTNCENSELAKLIIAMAKSLGLGVIAEGVETVAQLDFLKNNHCAEFQDYLVSPPVPAVEFECLLKTSSDHHWTGLIS